MTSDGPTVHHPHVPHYRRGRYRSPVNLDLNREPTRSEKIADHVTDVFGSWRFIIIQSVVILIWLAYNAYAAERFLHTHRFDPYPFILLNLVFSTQAAYAAPLILLSQNRTAARDRIKAEHDFDVNLLALRALAELLGDTHDEGAQRDLRRRIAELIGDEPDPEAGAGRTKPQPAPATPRAAPAGP